MPEALLSLLKLLGQGGLEAVKGAAEVGKGAVGGAAGGVADALSGLAGKLGASGAGVAGVAGDGVSPLDQFAPRSMAALEGLGLSVPADPSYSQFLANNVGPPQQPDPGFLKELSSNPQLSQALQQLGLMLQKRRQQPYIPPRGPVQFAPLPLQRPRY